MSPFYVIFLFLLRFSIRLFPSIYYCLHSVLLTASFLLSIYLQLSYPSYCTPLHFVYTVFDDTSVM